MQARRVLNRVSIGVSALCLALLSVGSGAASAASSVFQNPQLAPNPVLTVTDRDGETRISHRGGIFGYLSELRYFPHEDLSIVVLVNTAGPMSPSAIAASIEDAVLGPAAPLVPRAFGGDLAPFLGTYRGPARGRRMNAVVSEADGELRIKTGTDDPEPVRWLGGTTFANGSTRFTFVRGEDGFDVLQVDRVAGFYVLRRVTR